MKYEFGHKIKNGALVIHATKLETKMWIAICFWENSAHEYVIWRLDNEGNAYWGHYFSDMGSAIQFYQAKIEECLKLYGEKCPA
jgi:hypothetical protein